MKKLVLLIALMANVANAKGTVGLGMHKGQVKRIMGTPHHIVKTETGSKWVWNSGGKCFGFCHVIFKHGHVVVVNNIGGKTVWGN